MDPEKQEVVKEEQINPTGEVQEQSPEQLAEQVELQGEPASPPEPSEPEEDEIANIQEAIDRESDPEKRSALEKRRNAYYAQRRRQAKEAEEARLKAESEREEALRQAEYHRGMAEGLKTQPKPAAEETPDAEVPPHLLPARPRQEDFEDWEDFQVALGKYGARVELITAEWQRQQESQQAAQTKKQQDFQVALSRGRQKYADFMSVISNPALPITIAMWEAIGEDETGEEIAYHLGKNPQEAQRIAQLPERQMLREFGKISAKLSAPAPKQKTTTAAPEPIKPAPGAQQTAPVDLTDPDEWIKAERDRVKKLGRPY